MLTSSCLNKMARILKDVKDTESLKFLNRKSLISLYIYSEIFAWSYGIVNESDHPIVAKLDLSESQNMLYSTKGAIAKKTLKPGECAFMLHT